MTVHDEEDDDTPMPVGISADEANLFQVRGGGCLMLSLQHMHA